MSSKSPQPRAGKKQGKTLKEKRQVKKEKSQAKRPLVG
jgi:hypothetical protein